MEAIREYLPLSGSGGKEGVTMSASAEHEPGSSLRPRHVSQPMFRQYQVSPVLCVFMTQQNVIYLGC